MPITNYGKISDTPFYEGKVATLEPSVIRSGTNEETVPLVYGRAVCKGTADDGLIYPADADSQFYGIAKSTELDRRADFTLNADGDMGYPPKHVVSYLIRGVIAVKVTVAVTAGDPVFWIHDPGVGEKIGQFRNDANTAAAVQIPGAKFLESGDAGAVVKVSINLA